MSFDIGDIATQPAPPNKQYWIQEAIKHPGMLPAYVARKYGNGGFVMVDGRGKIKRKVLLRLAKKPGKIGKKARLALTLRKLRKR